MLRRYPEVGTVLRVDLNEGFRPPEMGKRRPAITLSPKHRDRPHLVTIVPLSTSQPQRTVPYNMELEFDPPLPHPYSSPRMWVKADLIMCVAFHRLHLLRRGRNEAGERDYDVRVVDGATLAQVRRCVEAALGWS